MSSVLSPDSDDVVAPGLAAPASSSTVTYSPEVQALIEEYTSLNEKEYRDRLAVVVFDGLTQELAAFHSDELAERTLTAAKHLVNEANNRLNNSGRGLQVDKRRHTVHFRDALGLERTRVQGFVDNLRQRRGQASNAPNASSRALRALSKRYPEEFVALKREFTKQIAQEQNAAKRERNSMRRELRTRSRSGT